MGIEPCVTPAKRNHYTAASFVEKTPANCLLSPWGGHLTGYPHLHVASSLHVVAAQFNLRLANNTSSNQRGCNPRANTRDVVDVGLSKAIFACSLSFPSVEILKCATVPSHSLHVAAIASLNTAECCSTAPTIE